jgi:uncharacterized protein (TIGR03435 family)
VRGAKHRKRETEPGNERAGKWQCRSDRGALTGKNVTLATIARVVERELGSPVIDETGLQGTYDVKLEGAGHRPI